MINTSLPGWKDKPLFTPGPLTTSATVKQAMLHDLGSRDDAFIAVVRDIRERLVRLATRNTDAFVAVPVQGSGTYAVEAVFSSCVPPSGKVLVLANGAYGERMVNILQTLRIAHEVLRFSEDMVPDSNAVRLALDDMSITMVAMVHCETTTGILNPLDAIGAQVREAKRQFFVDAMSSFGGLPIDLDECGIDYLVSSANKCIEGVPGFSFVIARNQLIEKTIGWSRSLCLDLHSQWRGLEENGQFRFTPPTHALLAFHQALLELESEGGVEAREKRYRDNHAALLEGMTRMGFKTFLSRELQGPIITSFCYPEHPNFEFVKFYRLLNERGYVIYPGKVAQADCFRIGTIGRIGKSDIDDLLHAIFSVLHTMNIRLV
ncbi:MAG: 2-aminoethylphosphonate--pyruvate transaminase [Candidatus Hydrogenedentota bacterium]